MCPQLLAVAGFAVSAASTVMGFAAQSAQADAQTAAWKQNYTNALAAARDDQNQLSLRQMQEGDAASQKTQMENIQVAQKSASVEAAAASGGVSGISVDSLVNDVSHQGDLNKTAIQRNFEATVSQLQTQKDATNDTAKSRINSMQPGTPPNPLSLAVGLAGDALGSYNSYEKNTGATG